MQEKSIASLEIKNQAGLKDGIASLRSFGMAAEEAFETWVFEQHAFHGGAAAPAAEPVVPKPEAARGRPRNSRRPPRRRIRSDHHTPWQPPAGLAGLRSHDLHSLGRPGPRPRAAAADWPQWRGPLRNGILPDSPPLADHWPAKGPAKLWESEPIPCDDDGGHGSVVAAGGRVYAVLVWHTDVPTETRAIDDLVLRQLGYQSVAGWPKETVAKMERDRLALDPSLGGAEFEKYLADWLQKNLDAKKRQTTAGYVRHRFERRGDAIPLEVYDRLLTVSKQRFPNQAALVAWLDQQNFNAKLKQEILDAVPPTMKVAQDVVLCLDLATGRTLWKCSSPGEATGRMASSTPCVAGGRVYALGSTHFYAVDAATGKLLWSAPLPPKARRRRRWSSTACW